jgi:HAMP domain-containing protein
VLARSRDHDRFVGKPLPSHLRNEARRHDGVTLTNNIDGARVLLAVAHSKLAEWRISVNAPVDVSEAQLTASLWLWGGVSAGIVSVAALLAFLLARRLEGPLNFTVDAARALGRGEPMLSFNSGLREANIVVDALNTASDELVKLATETGIMHRMRQMAPEKEFIAADPEAECAFMKTIDTARDLAEVLKSFQNEYDLKFHRKK